MRVVVIPSDLGACCFYRAAWPAQYVIKETGWKVELYQPDSVQLQSPGMTVRGIPDLESVDLIVLQRLATVRQFEFVARVQAMGIAVVVDVDDALWRIHPDNKSHERWTEVADGWPRFEHLDACCSIADMVTVSTPLLRKRYGVHGRVEVLRNGLPNVAFADNVTNAKTGFQDRIKIGWSGSLDSHPNDLQVMGDAVARIIQENDDVDLHIVGDAEPVADMLGIPKDVQFSRRVSGTGWLPLHEYHAALRDIDIMVVPLADTAFNRAKSSLKAQEGVAAGALVVASATPENGRLQGAHALYGAMPLDSTPDDWWKELSMAVQHRRGMGAFGDPYAVRHLAYETRGMEWARVWDEAVQYRKAHK